MRGGTLNTDAMPPAAGGIAFPGPCPRVKRRSSGNIPILRGLCVQVQFAQDFRGEVFPQTSENSAFLYGV